MRKWNWCLAASAVRDLEDLPEKVAAAMIESLDTVASNPYRLGKPLKFQLEGLWSARRGPYRLIYKIDQPKRLITVVAVDHRRDVYR